LGYLRNKSLPRTANRVEADSAMQSPKAVDNFVLVGFMGSGKSSVGREIARRRHMQFLDTDSIIRQKYSKSISEIFATVGELTFRAEETRCLEGLQSRERIVLATGGGIVSRAQNRSLIKSLGIVIWLTASEEMIWDRVSRNNSRPMLQTSDPRTTIRQLLTERGPFYHEVSNVTVETTGLSHCEVADLVLLELDHWLADEARD
jgi:shikimate kinase